MFCPECGGEFKPEISTCPECEVDLEVTEPVADSGNAMVRVYRSADASLLPVIQSLLEASAIPVTIQGGETAGLFPFGPVGGGSDDRYLGAVILVPEDRADEAKELLTTFEPGTES